MTIRRLIQHITLLSAGFGLFSTNPAAATILEVSLEKVLIPFQFREHTESTLELQLRLVTDRATKECQFLKDSSHPVCLWPRVVEELNKTGQFLSKDSYDPENLQVTLAARMHPITLLRYYQSGQGFDSVYARFLIAQKLMRDLWPQISETVRPPTGGDLNRWIIPWIGSKTPLSFALNLSRSYSCLTDSGGCGEKRTIVAVLQRVFAAIDEDPKLAKLLDALNEATKSQKVDNETHGLYRDILNGLTDQSSGKLLMFSANTQYSNLDRMAVKSYLDEVETDAGTPIQNLIEFSGQACDDIVKVLESSKSEPGVSWASKVYGAFECAQSDGNLTTIGGSALQELQHQKLTWRFNLYHLRLMLLVLFEGMRAKMDPIEVKLRQYHELLTDIDRVYGSVQKIQQVQLKSDDLAKLKPQMSVLYRYVLNVQKKAREALNETSK